ncbi:uncharacterized protein LOC127703017 [Mytilus californianus]|uniref:uncharacterized protein LOC127703017 n=1 Tax=Mytilus californianus TaxID=6549 RepID=UPI002247E0B1|nr:uncharacterized protein LOC127703017 [Mytilus californianus]XP_052063355.1 uncharacterized protein LOC127703017 [Mytilus californianus]
MTTCKKHETEEVRFFCEECKELICDDCVVGDHSICIKTKISEYGQRQKRALQETTETASEIEVPKINRILEQVKNAKQSFNSSVDKEIASVCSKTENIIKIFNEIKVELIKSFEDACKTANDTFDKITQEHTQRKDNIQETVDEIEQKGSNLSTTDIAIYDSKLNELLNDNQFVETSLKIEIPKHCFHKEYEIKENLRHILGILDYGEYDLPSPIETLSNTDVYKLPSKRENDKEDLTIENSSRKNIEIQRSDSFQTTSSNVADGKVIYSEEKGSDFYGLIPKRKKFEVIISFKHKQKVFHIIPKKECRNAWLIGSGISDLNLNTESPTCALRISSLDGNVLTACRSNAHGLLIGMENKKTLRNLQVSSSIFSKAKNYKLISYIYVDSNNLAKVSTASRMDDPNNVAAICTSSIKGSDIVICLRDDPMSESKFFSPTCEKFVIEWYSTEKQKTKDIVISSDDIEIRNPIHICENRIDGDICITCSPKNLSSWILLLDKNGKYKMRYPSKNQTANKETETNSFIVSGFLNDGTITILDRTKRCQHLIDRGGKNLQIDLYHDQPICLAVDMYDNLWVGFDNEHIRVINYNDRYETYIEHKT